MKHDCLIEIGCEELPANIVTSLGAQIAQLMRDCLSKREVEHTDIITFNSPRRLAFIINNLASTTPGKTFIKQGPYLNRAFDDNKKPTRAAIGFAESCGVSLEAIDSSGDRLCYEINQPGEEIKDNLLDWLSTDVIAKLQGFKGMRWGKPGVFIRPIQWLMALHGNNLLKGDLMGVVASDITFGHRFMSHGPIKIKHVKDYQAVMQANYVEPCQKARLKIIKEQINNLLPKMHSANLSDSLLEEVSQLVEWPVVLIGSFDNRYLQLPAEVLNAVLNKHQKCFTVNDGNSLSNKYLIISNIESKLPEQVIKGNNHVISARLADAWFFYEQDAQSTLIEHGKKLSGMLYQAKLGSMADKVTRLENYARQLASILGVEPKALEQAAQLCKADLACELVNELPEIQGHLAKHFALKQGYSGAIADALASYRQALPEDRLGQALAIIDQLDHLVSFYSIGLQPSGDKDPFAMRRAATAVLNCLLAKDIDLSVCLDAMTNDAELKLKVTQLILERMNFWCRKNNIGLNYLSAIEHLKQSVTVNRLAETLEALSKFGKNATLTACYRRLHNITKKMPKNSLDGHLKLIEKEELALQQAVNSFKPGTAISELEQLLELSPLVDAMLDNIFINVEQETLRDHRQQLLQISKSLFLRIADFTKI